MTIETLIAKVQEEKPNSFTDQKLVTFVNEIEAETAEQLGVDAPLYTTDMMQKDLLVPAPYDRLYVSYVKSQIDYANEEYDSYQNNAAQHVQDFMDFSNWVVRTNQKVCNRFPVRFMNVF